MASQPVKQNLIAKLALLAAEQSIPFPDGDSPEPAAEAYLNAYMAQGGKLSRLANELGVSRWLIDLWIRESPERRENYTRARALGADALVDEGGDLLDKADRDTIAVANARAGWRKWLASKYDPQTYGESKAQVSIGSLHLHAAQRPSVPLTVGFPTERFPKPEHPPTETFPAPPEETPKPPHLGAPPRAGGGGVPDSAVDKAVLPAMVEVVIASPVVEAPLSPVLSEAPPAPRDGAEDPRV